MDPKNWATKTNFSVNDVEDAGEKRAILLSVCRSKTYALMRNSLQQHPTRQLVRRLSKLWRSNIHLDQVRQRTFQNFTTIIAKKMKELQCVCSPNIVITTKLCQKCFETI